MKRMTKNITEEMTEFWVDSHLNKILQAVCGFIDAYDMQPTFVMMGSRKQIPEIPHPDDLVIVAFGEQEFNEMFDAWPTDDLLYESMCGVKKLLFSNELEMGEFKDVPILAIGLTAYTTTLRSLHIRLKNNNE